MGGSTGRKPNDPAGLKGIDTLQPGQRRRYGDILVYRKTLNSGQSGFTVTFPNGCIMWYRFAYDVVPAVQQRKPVEPLNPFEIITLAGREYEAATYGIIKRPDAAIW